MPGDLPLLGPGPLFGPPGLECPDDPLLWPPLDELLGPWPAELPPLELPLVSAPPAARATIAVAGAGEAARRAARRPVDKRNALAGRVVETAFDAEAIVLISFHNFHRHVGFISSHGRYTRTTFA